MTTEEEDMDDGCCDEGEEDNEASSIASSRRGAAAAAGIHMKSDAVEAADRDVQKIVSGKSSARNSTRSQKSRTMMDNSSKKMEEPHQPSSKNQEALTTAL